MIEKLQKENYEDVVEKCVKIIRDGLHLKLFDSRRIFVEELSQEKSFTDLLDAMVHKYIALLSTFVTGKRFAQFEQAWLCHIEDYFTETPITSEKVSVSLCSMWKAVVHSIRSKPTLGEQRIVLSTVAYTVYDLMTEKVKGYKTEFATSAADHSSVVPVMSTCTPKCESNVSLYRYMVVLLYIPFSKSTCRHQVMTRKQCY